VGLDVVSLYYVQKYLFELNRSEQVQSAYEHDRQAAIAAFANQGATFTDREVQALVQPDVGLLFHLGVNGQILMHFAAFHQIEWQDYLQQMRDGIAEHGPVQEGVYAVTGYEGTDAHAADLGHEPRSEGTH